MNVIIIGAGMAGLTCATYLNRRGHTATVVEASDGVGGRIRTDERAGFHLDRGFQILLTQYPELRRLVDLEALQLGSFESGALVQLPEKQVYFPNPLQGGSPLAALTAPVGSVADKLRMLRLSWQTEDLSDQDFFDQPAATTADYLEDFGWSDQCTGLFLKPFFSGVFLDESLGTSANLFRFLFKQFHTGKAALPAGGMQALPRQLATRLPAGSIRLNTPAVGIEGRTVLLQNGERLRADAVVMATDASAAARLLGQPQSRPFNRSTCTYFAAPVSPLPRPMLLLNPNRHSPIHHMAVLSDVANGYAPPGQSLISISTNGLDLVDVAELTSRILVQAEAWFGGAVSNWRHLHTYHLPEALPALPAPASGAVQALCLGEGLYRCGDYTAYPSLNAAMLTGRLVAEQLLA